MTLTIDQHARATYRAAEAHLSTRTIAELNRRRITTCTADEARHSAPRWRGWSLTAPLGSACALAFTLTLLLPSTTPPDMPAPSALTALEEAETLDVLDTINLTALDEDSDFFLWLATHEASLLAME